MSEIYLPNGQLVTKARDSDGKGRAVGLTPWKELAWNGRNAQGATAKKGNWKDYYGMYKRHPIVRAAIDKIAKTATNVGYDFVPRDSRAEPKPREIKVLQAFFDQQEDFIYELRRVYKDLLIYGDAYLYVIPDRKRRPVRLKRLSPKTIQIKAATNGKVEAYYQKDPDDITSNAVHFAPHEILHFRIDDPDNDLYGLSPLESLKDAVATDIYATMYNGAFFKNSAVTGTIIAVRNANPDEVERNRRWLEENYQGPGAAHKPLVIEGESVDVKKSVASHMEMGFLEGRKFIIQEILAVLDVPPSKLGFLENANRSNSREQDKTFRTESVTPLQYIVESTLNDGFIRKILGVEHTIFKHSEADARDQLESMEIFTRAEAWGIMTPNEVRSRLGMAPVDGGDTPFIMTPTGAVPLDRMQLYFQIPKTNIDKVPPHPDDPPEGEDQEGGVGPLAGRRTNETQPEPETTEKFVTPPLAAQGLLMKLSAALTNDNALRQAYSYAVDASESGDTRILHVVDVLQKACRTDDTILRQGYIERAHETMSEFIKPVYDHLPETRYEYDE
jgi:HK97 family phage portal protein